MLNSWVWALSVKRWEDMALLNDPSMMNRVECAKSSKGLVRTGWHCLFSPMPHLCEFPSAKVRATLSPYIYDACFAGRA